MIDRLPGARVRRALGGLNARVMAVLSAARQIAVSSGIGVPLRGAFSDALLLRRVRWRLVAWSGGTTLVVIGLLGTALYLAAANSLAANSRQQLEARAAMISRFIEESDFGRGFRAPPIGFSVGGPASGTFAFVVGPAGQAFGPPDISTAVLPDQAGLAAARGGQRDVRQITLDDTPLRILTEPVTRGNQTFLVQIVQDTTSEQRTLGALVAVLVGVGLLGLAGAMVVGAIYAGHALVPIRESLRRQREFAADASHEFRTPLAVIRSSVEHLERHRDQPVSAVGDALGDIRDEVDHLTALVGDLLLLARTDSGAVELDHVQLDLADVAGEALGSVSALAANKGVEIVLDPEPTPVVGDSLRLRQLVTLLVDNAIAFSPPNGTVTVMARSTKAAGILRVDDQGPGIRAEDIPHVFDRFWRAPGAPEGGTGLGLAIAAWITERHGGTIAAQNRPQGGATFEVRLPSAPA